MLSTDYYYINQKLQAVRYASCRADVLYVSGMVWGYLAALFAHGGISLVERRLLEVLLENAQQYAMATVNDLEIQGWA